MSPVGNSSAASRVGHPRTVAPEHSRDQPNTAWDRSAQDSLLTAKLSVAPRPAGLVYRGRLLDRLQSGVEGPLTLVSAAAGTGKTTIVASWAASGDPPGPVVWVSLDDGDLTPGTMWFLVVEGLRRAGVDLRCQVSRAGADIRDGPFLSTLAENIAGHRQPVVLVLDCDGTLGRDDAMGLDYLLRRSGDRLRLILVGRVEPLLPLHRYRLANSIAEIRLADLAFSSDEARELLSTRGVALSPATMNFVMRRTHGWAAGLIMLSMFLANRADPEESARAFSGDTGTVAEYLLCEVLDAQSPAARALLLSTSVVDVLRPGLVEALAGQHAPRALSFLAHSNALLEAVPEADRCYRYHPLFRELLRAQLSYESPGEVGHLHRTAAGWLAGEGMVDDAVRHAVAADAWEEAAGYLVDDLAIGQLLVEGGSGRFNEMLAKLPPEAPGACASLVRAAYSIAHLDLTGGAEQISVARSQLGTLQGTLRPAAELSMQLLALVHARATSDTTTAVQAAASAERLLQVSEPGRLAAHPELRALVGSNLGRALLRAGRLEAAADAFTYGADTDVFPGREPPVIDCLSHLALIAAWRGHLGAAADVAEQAVEVRTGAGIPVASCPSPIDVALAWVRVERYDLPGARRHVQRANESRAAANEPVSAMMLALVNARLCRATGDTNEALVIVAEASLQLPPGPSWMADRLRLEETALARATGRPAPAVEPTSSLRDGRTTLATRVDSSLRESFRQLRHGDEQRAAQTLEHALRLAAPERLRRPFHEAPREVRELLQRDAALADHRSWLGGGPIGGTQTVPRQRLTERPTRPEGHASPPVVEPLTAKEREVLSHLDELLTTEEIAEVMFVSVNTVRTHVRNILRKLSATRRNEAIRRARQLHLISD
ncbi:MAG: LuxR C-terminal-related transcriptional regulator [Actinomycetes bacterium]